MEKNKKINLLRRFLATGIIVTFFAAVMFPVLSYASNEITRDDYYSVGGKTGGQTGIAPLGHLFANAGIGIADGAEAAWDWASSGEKDGVTTFSDFKGGLTAPSGEGLDKTLKQTDNARQFIINVVNFVLGFLGLAAVIVMVYAGILYLTAAGNEDNTNKAKNAIKYAVIGIIIIASSYAVVNTLIKFAGTGESDRVATNDAALHGSATGNFGGTNSGQGSVYSLGAAEIRAAMNQVVNAYKTLVGISGVFTKINNIEAPNTLGGYRVFLGDITNWVSQIRNNTDPFSETHLAAAQLLNEYFGRFSSMSDETLEKTYPVKKNGGEKLQKEVIKKLKDSLSDPPKNDFTHTLENLVGPLDEISSDPEQPEAGANVEGRLQIVWKILGPAANDMQASDPKLTNLVDPQELQKAFAGIDPRITVGQLFGDAMKKIKALDSVSITALQTEAEKGTASIDTAAADTQNFVAAMQSLSRLLIVVKNIKFVSAVITPNVTTGNVPLTVELSGLGSRDPTGATIPDGNYEWDQDGDGSIGADSSKVDCGNNNTSAISSCTFLQPGTYIVRLHVKSIDQAQVADGLATYAITVKPSLAMITLTAKVGDQKEPLREYTVDESGVKVLSTDKTEFHATSDEASRGIEFDATGSVGSNNSELKEYLWKFGDGSPDARGKTPEKHKYKKGRFPLTLEVADKLGRKDRMTVMVFIDSIAARILPQKTIVGVDELIEFDGSASHSDTGAITSYEWKVYSENISDNSISRDDICADGDITNKTTCLDIISAEGAPRLQTKFKQPGIYKVELTATDGQNTQSASIVIRVTSQKPRGVINMHACPDDCPVPSDPSIIDFDSIGSFDPDTDDVLNYQWELYNAVGDRLEAGPSTFQLLPSTGTQAAGELKMSGATTKQLRIKFARVGKYKMVLRIDDTYADARIRQEDVTEKLFEVKSTISVEWSEAMKYVAQLKDNRATITFAGTIRNADSAEIDFGDGESADLTVTGNNFSFNQTHVYDKAKEYIVTLRATSTTNGENSIQKRIVIAAGDQPRAVIRVFEDDNEVIIPDSIDIQNPKVLEVHRGVRLTFDAKSSITSEGSASVQKLNYSWDFGDGDASTKESVTHTYRDLTAEDGLTLIKLTVSEKDNPSKTDTQQFPLRVISSKPTLTALTLEKRTGGNETPVSVLVRAEGASDSDGRITNYQFWYYHPSNPDERFGVLDTASNSAEITVETYGDAGKENEFVFCVTLTDSDNTTAECSELLDENRRPRLLVKNGPNKAPHASFEVQPGTTVRVNEEVTFTSSSTDDDGQISKYIWDVEGDGFQNNNPTDSPMITHTYTKKSTSTGYKVKLKVIDDKNAAGYSRDIPIFVTTPSNPPRASFRYEADASIPLRMRFFDSSTPDQQNRAQLKEWKWDFDLSQEFGCSNDNKPEYCNGDKTDDADSTDQFPVFDFPTTGRYQVKLIVTDNFDTESEIIQFIEVRGGASGSTSGPARARSQSAQADLKAYYDNRFSSFEGQQKVLHVPANACAADVAFYWGDSRANDVPLFKLDRNIYHDGNGDGNRANDYQEVGISNECVLNGVRKNNCAVVSYQRFDQQTTPRGSGQFEGEISMLTQPLDGVQSTIIDKDSVKVVFDKTNNAATELTPARCNQGGNNLGGSVFNIDGLSDRAMKNIVGALLIIAGLFGVRSVVKKQ